MTCLEQNFLKRFKRNFEKKLFGSAVFSPFRDRDISYWKGCKIISSEHALSNEPPDASAPHLGVEAAMVVKL